MRSEDRWARLAPHVESCPSCRTAASAAAPRASLCFYGASLVALYETERLLEGAPLGAAELEARIAALAPVHQAGRVA